MCEKKRRKKKEEIREAKEARTEGRIWEIIRKEREERKSVEEDIRKETWNEYFMGLLRRIEE